VWFDSTRSNQTHGWTKVVSVVANEASVGSIPIFRSNYFAKITRWKREQDPKNLGSSTVPPEPGNFYVISLFRLATSALDAVVNSPKTLSVSNIRLLGKLHRRPRNCFSISRISPIVIFLAILRLLTNRIRPEYAEWHAAGKPGGHPSNKKYKRDKVAARAYRRQYYLKTGT
jgi:hypothetical protein